MILHPVLQRGPLFRKTEKLSNVVTKSGAFTGRQDLRARVASMFSERSTQRSIHRPEAQPMNVLARINNGPNPVATDPVREVPNSPAHKPLGTPRAYSGPSIISGALSIVGRLEGAGDIQVEGKIDGDIRGQNVRIGMGASVKGTVHGELVELAGTLDGKIEARQAVLGKTSRMNGDIIHQTLQIDEGSYFNGNSRPNFGK